MPASPNQSSSGARSPRGDGYKLREYRRRNGKQRYPLTSAETDGLQLGWDADDEMGHQSSTGLPKCSLQNYRSNSGGARGKARGTTYPIGPAETETHLAGSNKGFLSARSRKCQTPVQTIVMGNLAWRTSFNKTPVTCKTLDTDIPDEWKSDSEEWEQVYTPKIKVDTTVADKWNAVCNPAVFYGVIPSDQESEPGSDSGNFDKVYNSEADIDAEQEGSRRWVTVNYRGILCGAVSVESGEDDDGKRPHPQPLVEHKDWETWLKYWSQAKEVYSIVGQATRCLM